MKRKLPILFLCILTFLSISGCGDKKNQKYMVNITITVKDGQTTKGVAGANIIGSDKTGTTDGSGIVRFTNVEGNKKYTFTVNAKDYISQNITLDVKTQSVDYAVQLYKITGSITGIILDDNGKEIEGASIGVDSTSVSARSLSNGTFNITVPVSNIAYTLTVSKENYSERKVHNVFVTADKPNNDLGNIVLSNNPGKITGTATDQNGNAIMNVTVFAKEADKQVTTNGYGIYTVEVLPGTYTLIFSNQYYIDKVVPGVEVQSNKNTIINTQLTAKPGFITGTIRDRKDKAISDVVVTVLGTSLMTATDATGYFRINDVPAGNYTIQFSHDYYKSKTANITVDKAEETAINSISLDPKTGTVYGIVVDRDNKTAINGAVIKSLTTGDTTTSMTNGSFQLNNIRIGVHRISITATDYSTAEITVTVEEDRIENINEVQLFKNPSSMYGSVRDKVTLKYIANASVMVVEIPSFVTQTDNNGLFRFDNLPANIYSINIDHPDYHPRTISSIGVEPLKATNVGMLDLTPKPGTIQGTTTPGARVSLQATSYNVTASETGRFVINNVNPGNYIIEITRANYEARSMDITLAPAQTLELGNIPLDKLKGSITGTIKDSITQEVLSDVMVTVLEVPTNTGSTDTSGVFTVSNLEVGRYTLKFDYANYISQNSKTIDVIANQTVNIGTINLVPRPARIQGTTTPGAILNLRATSYSTTANGTGAFILENIQPGKYTLDISLTNYDPKSTELTLSPNETRILGDQTLTPIPGKINGLTNASTVAIMENGKSVSVTNGTFTITSLTPGTYTLNYTRSGYISQTKVVEVAPNGTTDAGNVILEPETGTITGYITCTGGNITLVETKGTQFYNNPAYFTFNNLMPGTYHITLQKPDYQSTFYTVTVEPGQTTDLGNINIGRRLDGIDGDQIEDTVKTWRINSSNDLEKQIPLINADEIKYEQDITVINYFDDYIMLPATVTIYRNGSEYKKFGAPKDTTEITINIPANKSLATWTWYGKAGSTRPLGFNVYWKTDTGKPKITITRTWEYGPTAVTITGEDTYAGIKSVQYSLSSSPTTAGTYQNISNGGTVTINNKGVWYLHMKVTDNGNNISTRVEGPFIIP